MPFPYTFPFYFEGLLPPPTLVTRKVLVTHPAIKTVQVFKDSNQQESYDNLSNLDELRIENAIEFPIPVPSTVVVTTLSGEQWTYPIL